MTESCPAQPSRIRVDRRLRSWCQIRAAAPDVFSVGLSNVDADQGSISGGSDDGDQAQLVRHQNFPPSDRP
jgi:hypothetical protein